jgi:hypothetical protein
VSQLTKKIYRYSEKIVDSFKMCMISLKYWSWFLKRMIGSLKIHIIYHIVLVEMIICHLQVCAPYRPADESMNEFALPVMLMIHMLQAS